MTNNDNNILYLITLLYKQQEQAVSAVEDKILKNQNRTIKSVFKDTNFKQIRVEGLEELYAVTENMKTLITEIKSANLYLPEEG